MLNVFNELMAHVLTDIVRQAYIYPPSQMEYMIGGTTVGPLTKEVRDRLADYRDRENFSNYNEAVENLLNNVNE